MLANRYHPLKNQMIQLIKNWENIVNKHIESINSFLKDSNLCKPPSVSTHLKVHQIRI